MLASAQRNGRRGVVTHGVAGNAPRRLRTAWVVCLAVCLSFSVVGCVAPASSEKPADRSGSRAGARDRTAEAPDYQVEDEEPSSGRIHVVQPGDTLWNLAVRYYGHGKHLNKIRVANRHRLRDPSDLPVGMKLIVP